MNCRQSNKSGRVVLAVGLITLGAMSVMGLGLLWPVVFVLLPGLFMLWIAVAGGRLGAVSMAVPGMTVTGTGALLLVQNLTGHWSSWAYAWTLYGAFLGFAFTLMAQRLEEPAFAALGRWFVYASLTAFGVLGAIFELLIFNSSGLLGALLLIGLGLYLLLRGDTSERFAAALGRPRKVKRTTKNKRRDNALFTGPVVVGSTVRTDGGARVAVVDVERVPEPDDA